jgi:hypothetical protein
MFEYSNMRRLSSKYSAILKHLPLVGAGACVVMTVVFAHLNVFFASGLSLVFGIANLWGWNRYTRRAATVFLSGSDLIVEQRGGPIRVQPQQILSIHEPQGSRAPLIVVRFRLEPHSVGTFVFMPSRKENGFFGQRRVAKLLESLKESAGG